MNREPVRPVTRGAAGASMAAINTTPTRLEPDTDGQHHHGGKRELDQAHGQSQRAREIGIERYNLEFLVGGQHHHAHQRADPPRR